MAQGWLFFVPSGHIELIKDVAREYRIGIMAVHRDVKKAQSNPLYLEVAVE